MAYRTGLAILVLAITAVTLIGCDEDTSAGKGLVGTWVRTKNFEIGANTRNDTWTLTFEDNGTFTMLHQRTDSLETSPLTGVESRQGTYSVNGAGNLVIEGDWLDLASNITSLGDLDGNMYTYFQTTNLILDKNRGLLFVGPDFNEGSSYVAGDSYSILYSDGANSYTRNISMVLSDFDGNVIEERTESYTFNIVDDKNCEGSFTSAITQGGTTNEGSGTFTACTYTWDPGRPVDSVGGGTEEVAAVVFEFTANGVDRIEYYIGVGDHFLSYPLGYQQVALVQSAFIKVQN